MYDYISNALFGNFENMRVNISIIIYQMLYFEKISPHAKIFPKYKFTESILVLVILYHNFIFE